MKKFLSIMLVSIVLLCGTGLTVAFAANNDVSAPTSVESYNLYLAPGTYVKDGVKKENVISEGAQKLAKEKCDEIYTENAYVCTLSVGQPLPKPTSDRVDKSNTPYVFNGWWTIVDATVTYFNKVPSLDQTAVFYADWRADLSQRRDPIIPDDNAPVKALHYMNIKRAKTGETEIITLRVSGTDMASAETLGYGAPVQLYNGWFELSKGDVISVYSIGLSSNDAPVLTPILSSDKKRSITLESSGDGLNVTANYLTYAASQRQATLTCIAETSRHYRIYIKYYSGGTNMAVYMEPMD